MKKIIYTIIGILFVSFPVQALAYSNWGSDVEIFSIYDVFFDILSFSVAVVALGIGFQMVNKLSGGLKSTWIYYMIVILLFVILQIFSLLSVFNIFKLSGLFAIIKLIMVVAFLSTVLSARSFVQKILRAKFIKDKGINSKE